MAMMAARGLHGYSMPSHTSALNTFLGKPATTAGLMPAKKASQIAFYPTTLDKQPLYKQTVSGTQQRPVLKASSTSNLLPEVASKDSNKENVDPLSFLRSQFRFQAPSSSLNARPTSTGGYKRKFEMDPSPTYRQPLKDITAEVLQRDYKIKMTSRNEATRVPSYYPQQSTPFHFAPPSTVAPSKLERPIRQPTSPRKKASQPAALPSLPTSSFTFDKTLNKIVSTSLGGVPQMKPFVPTVQQPVMRTAVKKDHLFDMHVQLGLLKPTAEQLKLKAPATPFAAPRQTMDFFSATAAKKKSSSSSSRSFALGRI